MSNTTDRIRQLTSEHLGVAVDTIQPESTFDSLGADSLDKIELLLAVEDTFEVEIDEAISSKWTTIGEVEVYVAAHVKH